VQLTRDFTLRDALACVDYWHALGVTDLYASPFFTARAGSTHGYDVVDPRALNPEIGTDDDLARLHEALKARGMGLLIDVVPNHMCVNTNENVWWNDVLENGPSSEFAKFFDIDWRPPKAELRDKVLLPVLGDQYGKVLENAELRLGEAEGAFDISYFDRRFPIAPGTYSLILAGVLARLRSADPPDPQALARLESLVMSATRLPSRSEADPARLLERRRGKEELKARLQGILREHPAARSALDEDIRDINGQKGNPRSFDRLEALLAEQAYRLSYWRVAAEHINYRRFFEINDLAAVRIEEPEVLETVHAKAFELLARGIATGLRIDHIDGLREPRRYLDEVAKRTEGAYVVVEKILAADESLPADWATDGTTGYEFLNTLNGVLVAPAGEKALRGYYDGLRTVLGRFGDVGYESRRLVLRGPMSSELSVLARRLDRISEQHRWSRDLTIGTLTEVLVSTIACFPVYRTYVAAGDAEASPGDVEHVMKALAAAKRRSASIIASAFDFLGDVLLMRDPQGLLEPERAERRDFVLRFQQVTGPVMAKGIEDTAFFRHFSLLSLNEVGGGPARFGSTVAAFHASMVERAQRRPAALSATQTHDTKRAEDHRTRLDVLSEIPAVWTAAVTAWREAVDALKSRINGAAVPDADDEYYAYQTIVGACPAGPMSDEGWNAFSKRVEDAMIKALREAKRNSSWINPNPDYEEATRGFVSRLLEPSGSFVPMLTALLERVTNPGLMASLAQLAIKSTAPGVPDFFQGTELWDFSMTDPDNRRPVDFASRSALMTALAARLERRDTRDRAALVHELRQTLHDGRLKLLMTRELLGARRDRASLFARGAYVPLAVDGPRRDQVVAFARRMEDHVSLTVTGRFFASFGDADPWRADTWSGTVVEVPGELSATLHDAVTGAVRTVRGSVPLADLFESMPFAVLVGDPAPARA
jgi:(1->4)-alpha-D-glucan 1-alpha-D-glucosylmutase